MTTSYITPITDRTWEDIEYAKTHQSDLTNKNKGAWNYTDCNRVCNNLKYAAEYMFEQGFLSQPYVAQIKTDWTETDIITIEQLNTMIINNMNNLKAYSRDDLEWYYIPSITNLNYDLANWIEKNIHQLATQLPPPPDTFRLTVENGSGSGNYEARTVVEIRANTSDPGLVFDHWSGDHLENIGDATASITTYTMPNEDVILKANYTGTTAHSLVVTAYTGHRDYNLYMGSTVQIEADPAPQGKVFHHWNVEPAEYERNLYEPASTTTFTMPNEDVTITAEYITTGKKELRVINGTGSGLYDYNSLVFVSPTMPANAVFTGWTGDVQYLTSSAMETYNSVKIPDVTVISITANWVIPPITNVGLNLINGIITSSGTSSGVFTQGTYLNIVANSAPNEQIFSHWVINEGDSTIYNSSLSNTKVTIGTTDTTITAIYRNLEYHQLTVTTNSGTNVTIKEKAENFSVDATPIPNGYVFDKWIGDTEGLNVYSATTNAVMGSTDRSITAIYRLIDIHTLTVKQLSGDVVYSQNELSTIQIVAENAPTGKRFLRWDLTGYGRISNTYVQNTIYTFGEDDGILTPVYVNIWEINVVDGTVNGLSQAILDQGSRYSLNCRRLEIYEQFNGWTNTGLGVITNTSSTATYYTVGASDDTITANITHYPDKTLTIYFQDPDTNEVSLVSRETYTYGSQITITAPVAPNKTTFLSWIGADQDISLLSPSALASTATVSSLTKDASLTATYYYPEAPEYYTLSVYNGYPQNQSIQVGTQVQIRANAPDQGFEFFKWYGDTQYIVNQEGLDDPENSIIMPKKSITLYAKYKVIGELPLFRVSVSNGKASATYTTGEEGSEIEHNEEGVYIDIPADTEVTLTSEEDLVGWVFDYWDGNFEAAGVTDLVATNNPTVFTMPENDINATAIRRELDKYTIYTTNAVGPGTVYPSVYPISGNKNDSDDVHYTFLGWDCVDADEIDCISAIANPASVETTITVTDKDLWITANYKAYYKLTVVNGQDTGNHYYYNGEIVNSITADTPMPGSNLIFDHWEDPVGVCSNIYDPTPTITMKDSTAMITATYVSTDTRGNSIVSAGNDLHLNRILRSTSTLINGIYAVGTITFDRDGCIGIITETDPDHNDNTDDYGTQKFFYGGNF